MLKLSAGFLIDLIKTWCQGVQICTLVEVDWAWEVWFYNQRQKTKLFRMYSSDTYNLALVSGWMNQRVECSSYKTQSHINFA